MSKTENVPHLDPKVLENYTVLFKESEILKAVQTLAEEINDTAVEGNLVFVTVLEGAKRFRDDLEPYINLRHENDTVKTRLYDSTEVSADEVEIVKPLDNSVDGKDVIIIEDVLDTGITLTGVVKYLKNEGARDVKIAVLIEKVKDVRKKDIVPDYSAIKEVRGWLIGHGFDVDGEFRELPDILVKKDTV